MQEEPWFAGDPPGAVWRQATQPAVSGSFEPFCDVQNALDGLRHERPAAGFSGVIGQSQPQLLVEGDTFRNGHTVHPHTVPWCFLVRISERDAEEHLVVFGNVEHLSDRPGEEAQHGLGDATQTPRRERQQERLAVHANISTHSDIVAEGGHEQQSDLRSAEE
nr:hypothetical protein [Paracoccus saliphilus]